MKIEDLMEMPLKDILEEFCITFSPECGYYYGVANWDDVYAIYDKYDLEEEYCFSGDSLIPFEYGIEDRDSVLTFDDLECIMDKLGMQIKRPCPKCGSDNFHFDYNAMAMACNDCEYIDIEKDDKND